MRKKLPFFIICAVVLVSYLFFPSGDTLSGMEVTYLDVGNADCQIIRIDDGTNIVIDAATKDRGDEILAALKGKGVTGIDYLIATHPHSDHIGSMEQIMEEFPVKNVVLPNVLHTSQTYENMLQTIKEKNIHAIAAEAGVVLRATNQYRLKLVAPKSGQTYESLNDYSAVLHVTYGSRSFLFTGDAEKASEQEMMEHNISADVLKVGHHGSETSSSEEFIRLVNPNTAVISCGKRNSYGHPHKETLQTLSGVTVYRTDENGTITIHTDGNIIRVSTER